MDSDMMPLDTLPAPQHFSSAPSPSRLPPMSRNPIRVFADAIQALKSCTFNTSDLSANTRATALHLHQRTFEVINAADISNLQAARSVLSPSTHFLAYIATLHAAFASLPDATSPILPSLIADWRALVAATPPAWARAAHLRWVGAARHAARLAMTIPIDSQVTFPTPPFVSSDGGGGGGNRGVNSNSNNISAMSLVRALHDASAKLATRPDALVPTQADFLAASIHARAYSLAASWLREHRRLYADPNESGITTSDVHLIYHYGALVLAGVKDFRAALQMCRLALAVPFPYAGSFFAVAVPTYRLYVLINLLVSGRSAPVLKFSSYPAGSMRKLASEYVELAYAVEKVDIGQARRIVQSNETVFHKDGTVGLVKQVMVSLSERAILRLADSYVTLRLSDVASKAGLSSEEQAQAVLMRMTESNKINAVIDEREKMVRLLDKDVREDERVAEHVESANMSACLEVVRRIEDFRHDLECDPEYVGKESRTQQTQGQQIEGMQQGTSRRALGMMAAALSAEDGDDFDAEV